MTLYLCIYFVFVQNNIANYGCQASHITIIMKGTKGTWSNILLDMTSLVKPTVKS